MVTVPLRKLKSCGRKLLVIQKYKRLGSQICFLSKANEQDGRRENVRIFGVEEQTGDDVYQQVVDVVKGTGVGICKSDISVWHRLPAWGRSGEPISVKFVRRETKLPLMTTKSGLRHQSSGPIYINDDITQLRARLLKTLKEKPDVKAANMINEKKTCTEPITIKLFFKDCLNYTTGIRVWSCVYVLIN